MAFSILSTSQRSIPVPTIIDASLGTPRYAFDNQGDRAVVDQRYRHVRLKYSGLHLHSRAARRRHEMLIQFASLLRRRRQIEAGTPALAAIAVQSELRNRQDRAAGLEHAPVHLAGLVGKYTQSGDLFGEEFGVHESIGFGDPQEDQQPRADLASDDAIDLDLGLSDSLHDRPHISKFSQYSTKVDPS